MSGVLLHDGRSTGHDGWCTNAIIEGAADGVFISPFNTPRITLPRYPSGANVAQSVRAVAGEVVFDPMTHARLLATTNKIDLYDTWELWGPDGLGLDTPRRRLQHVERVFAQQETLRSPYLAPTMILEMPQTADSEHVIATAQTAKGLERECWQSLAGTRSFWRAGPRLDAFVGQLAALRSPVWVITVANEVVINGALDLSDSAAFAGLCRTIHSLSERSRVILTHADFAGLIGAAAGANTIGSGWYRSMRVFDPNSFHTSSEDSIRIPASYVTQGALTAVLRRDTADAIERWNSTMAFTIRGGQMPASDQVERLHHLKILRELVTSIDTQNDRRARVKRLRQQYDTAGQYFDTLINALPRTVLASDKRVWRDCPFEVLRAYAAEERIW
jgi:hypothetical protein